MIRKSGGERRDQRKPPAGGRTLRRLALAALTALSIASPLVLSESTAPLGTGIFLVVLHLVLAIAWLAARLVQGAGRFRCDLISIAVVGLAGWHGISALVMGPSGTPRPAINMCWQWVAYATAFLLVRDLARTPRECRALCAVMTGLAVGLSAHAYFQYFVEMPRLRAAYRADPERMLHEQRLYSPEGSVAREVFENRLFSSEPTATFALTNSLAGFLAPWLVLTLAAASETWRRRAGSVRYFAGACGVAVAVGGCLLLTKSRTAVLATAFGVFLIVASLFVRRWKLGWKIPLAAATVTAVLVGGAIGVGSLDTQVVSEAPKSLLYRFQYWNASLRLVADYPWFGCGPGNFQQYYTAYMLPEASEQVADPHNFLLEVWATAGTPALLLLLAVLGGFAWRAVREGERVAPEQPDPVNEGVAAGADTAAVAAAEAGFTKSAELPVYAGAIGGLLLAYPIGLIAGVTPAGAVYWLGLPAGAAVVWWLHPWVVAGVLSTRSLAIAVAVLAVNLLAAGGIGFPGVAVSLWLLMALALNLAGRSVWGWDAPPRVLVVVLLVTLALLAACLQTAYLPILNGRVWSERGEALVYASRELSDPAETQRTLLEALQAFERAAQADRFAAKPRMDAARIFHEWRLRLPDDAARAAAEKGFALMARDALRRDRHSHAAVTAVAFMDFEAYDALGDERHLKRARQGFRRAVDLYPNHNFTRARLAWMDHLAGDEAAASEQAVEALRLDRLTPHAERKLAARGLFDDLAAPGQLARLTRLPAGKSAEQLMQRLRSEME